MEFFAILIVFAAVQLWGSGGSIQQDSWLQNLYQRCQFLNAGRARIAAVVLLPLAGLLLLAALLDPLLFGIPLLILYVLVLLYSIGRGDFTVRLNVYLDCWRRGDIAGAFENAVQLDDFNAEQRINNAQELHLNVRRATFYQGFERWFAVIFWFVLLGPVLAFAYRLLFLLAHSKEVQQADRDVAAEVLYYLEWLPARALGFTFALVGNFESSFRAFTANAMERRQSAELLDQLGEPALAKVVPSGLVEGQEFSNAAAEELNLVQVLLSRSLLVWLVVIALAQLF